MSFSAFNVGTQMMTFTSNKIPELRLGSKPVAGGSFTPTTLEAAFVLRSSLDYQFEKAFNDKYRALMQNRLNDLQKKLQDAYADLLNMAMGQQVGQSAAGNLRSDVRLDGMDGTSSAQLLPGLMGANGFEDLGIVPKTASKSDNLNEKSILYGTTNQPTGELWRAPGLTQDLLDANGTKADDGASGYGRQLGTLETQFRVLQDHTTAAGAVAGDINVTMRLEGDPAPPANLGVCLDLLNSVVSSILGGPPDPTYFNQKVVQSSTTYKTGGFWSAINYLYDFAPKELKYTYAVGYTANSDEAGDDEYLIDGEPTDITDIPGSQSNTNYQDQDYLKTGDRLKWATFDPTEGYSLERSGTYQNGYGTVINRDAAWTYIDSSGQERWYTDPTSANTVLSGTRQIVQNLILSSGTYVYNGTFVNEYGNGAGVAGTQMVGTQRVQYSGTSQGGMTSLLNSNIELGSIFRNKVEMDSGINGGNDDNINPPSSGDDFHVLNRGANRSSLFFNHYEVETRTVEFNNSSRKDVPELTAGATFGDISDDGVGKIYAYGGIARSKSVDGSKNYDKIDGDITRADGNVAQTFNGEFIQSLHKIQSVNGQDIVGNQSKQASPVIGNFSLGDYEGVLRSENMSKNLVSYQAPRQIDVNAADSVPTDWYQAEFVNNGTLTDPAQGKIWFPYVDDTLYSGIGATGYGRTNGPRQVIQARNTFTLSQDELMQLQPATSWITDPTGVQRPTYAKKDYWIDVDLSGIHYDRLATPTQEIPKLFINGRQILLDTAALPLPSYISSLTVSPAATGEAPATLHARINIADFLQVGTNIMVIEASDATSPPKAGAVSDTNEGIRVTNANSNSASIPPGNSGGTNTPEVDDVINAKLITGYNYAPAVNYNPLFTRPNTPKVQSRWQTRIVPSSTEKDFNNKLVSMASVSTTTGSSYKTSNAFIEMIVNMINQQKYRDIFKLGLLSNLNKLSIQGQAQQPNGASMSGAVTLYFDTSKQAITLIQDKLIANS